MQQILNNPYRILGLLVGATAREQERQVRRLKQYVEADQEPENDFSFPMLGRINRTIDSIEEAASKLNLDNDKMNAAIFWFCKGNNVADEVAFDAMKEDDEFAAIEIWNNLMKTAKITAKNWSAFHNFSLYLLCTANNVESIGQAISLQMTFLESEFVDKIKDLATDITFNISKKELQLLFLNQVQLRLEELNMPLDKGLEIIKNQNFSAKTDFFKNIEQGFVSKITFEIETTRKKRINNSANAAQAGEELYQQIKNDLEQLKSIAGIHNFTYSNIADKLANEILQCGIDYFNYSQEIEAGYDYYKITMNLAILADRIAIGNLIKGKIKDNINTLDEMQFNAIQVLKVVKQVYNGCAWNQTVNEYKIVELIKEQITQQDVNKIKNSDNKAKKDEYKILVNFLMSKLSYLYKDRIKYLVYWNTTTSIHTQAIKANNTSTPKPTSSSSSKDGCYIATMVYGSYDHPQVLILRRFRDNVLDKSFFGRWFIKTYYYYSPKLVDKLKNRKTINMVIRKVLNQFIRIIR